MASPRRYCAALEGAGFVNVALVNRNPWYREVARDEFAALSGQGRPRLEAEHGADFIAGQLHTWACMIKVLESGEHCPHHLRGQRPV